MSNRSKSYRKPVLLSVLILTLCLVVKPLASQNKELAWTSFEDAIKIAKETTKPIMVDVWAPWCGWCKKMREEVYPELENKISSNFVLTRINRDDNSSKERYKDFTYTPLRLAQKLKVDTVPAIIFLSSEGEYIAHITGYRDSKKLDDIFEIVLE